MKNLLLTLSLVTSFALRAEFTQQDALLSKLELAGKKYDLASKFLGITISETQKAAQALSDAGEKTVFIGRSAHFGPKSEQEYTLEESHNNAQQLRDAALNAREKAALEYIELAKEYFLKN